MSSMTMHGIDPELECKLRQEAASSGKSLNQTLKTLLASAVGLSGKPVSHREDFIEFLGIWSEADKQAFDTAVAECSQVDEADWE